jgi:hypothetical protein
MTASAGRVNPGEKPGDAPRRPPKERRVASALHPPDKLSGFRRGLDANEQRTHMIDPAPHALAARSRRQCRTSLMTRYPLFSRAGIVEYQLLDPDPLLPRARGREAKGSSGKPARLHRLPRLRGGSKRKTDAIRHIGCCRCSAVT